MNAIAMATELPASDAIILPARAHGGPADARTLAPRGISGVTLRGWRKAAEAAKVGSELSSRAAGEVILSLLDEIDEQVLGGRWGLKRDTNECGPSDDRERFGTGRTLLAIE